MVCCDRWTKKFGGCISLNDVTAFCGVLRQADKNFDGCVSLNDVTTCCGEIVVSVVFVNLNYCVKLSHCCVSLPYLKVLCIF